MTNLIGIPGGAANLGPVVGVKFMMKNGREVFAISPLEDQSFSASGVAEQVYSLLCQSGGEGGWMRMEETIIQIGDISSLEVQLFATKGAASEHGKAGQ